MMNILVNIIFSTIFIITTATHSRSVSPWKLKHSKFRESLKIKSKKMMNDYLFSNSGQSTSVGILTTFTLSILIIVQLFFFLKNYLGSRSRVNTYLCSKYNTSEVKNAINVIGKYNLTIVTANAMMLYPQSAASGKIIKKYAFLAQEAAHLSFIKKFNEEKYCMYQNQLFWAKSFPYETGPTLLLKRNTQGLAKAKDIKWYFYSYSSPPKIASEQAFILRTRFSGLLSTALKTKILIEEF